MHGSHSFEKARSELMNGKNAIHVFRTYSRSGSERSEAGGRCPGDSSECGADSLPKHGCRLCRLVMVVL